MAPLTTLQVGGAARFFAEASTEEDIAEAFEVSKKKGLDVFVLGGGSNVVVSDSGFSGLVLRIRLMGKTQFESSVVAGAGEDWDNFVSYCVERNLAGLECLSGIPGFVGGTPVQNVGAYGQDVAETIDCVRCFDRKTGEFFDFSNSDCKFSYRKSVFNSEKRDAYVVTSVSYNLRHGGAAAIEYRDLKEAFGDHEPSLFEVRKMVIRIRASKSMVVNESDPNSRSAGSFFKNPIVESSFLDRIRISSGIDDVPHFPDHMGNVKIPAAWLIENAGFQKGFRKGNAGISTKHALAIVNCGGATANEIVNLKNEISDGVAKRFGIQLSTEPIFVGFEN